MCRWFAYISTTEECLLEDVLILPDHSLSKQVDDHFLPGLWPWETPTTDDDNEEGLKSLYDRNMMNNVDGLGIAWYSTTRSKFTDPKNVIPLPTLYKTLSNPPTDPNFISICATTASKTLFAHIRAASPAMPVNEANCHPFVYGRYTFMHNGGVGDFQAIKKAWITRLSEEAYANVMGITDSEHLAALYFTILSELASSSGGPDGRDAWIESYPSDLLVKAFDGLIKTVLNVQRDAARKSQSKASPSSLNMCVTDGVHLVAARFRSHAIQQPPSLYWTAEAGVVLNRKFEGTPDSKPKSAEGTASYPNPNPHAKLALPPKSKAAPKPAADIQNHFASHTSPIASSVPPSHKEVDYGTHSHLSASDHGAHLIVASEPTTKTEVARWHIIPKNSYVTFDGDVQNVKVHDVGVVWEKEIGYV